MAAVTRIVDEDIVLQYLNKADGATSHELCILDVVQRRAEAAVRKFLGTDVVQTTYTHFYPRGNPFDQFEDFRNTRRSAMFEWRGRRVDGLPTLRLSRFPVRSITTIHEDESAYANEASGAFPASTLLTEGEDYYIPWEKSGFSKIGSVIRVGAPWPARAGSIQVVYVAGWTQAELEGSVSDPELDASDIQLAVLITISEMFGDGMAAGSSEAGGAGEVKSERLGEYSITYSTQAELMAARMIGRRALNSALPLDAQALLRPYRRLTVFQ